MSKAEEFRKYMDEKDFIIEFIEEETSKPLAYAMLQDSSREFAETLIGKIVFLLEFNYTVRSFVFITVVEDFDRSESVEKMQKYFQTKLKSFSQAIVIISPNGEITKRGINKR